VIWSDHGFHLGEKEHIEKFALWEQTTHVPFIIIAPGLIEPGSVIEHPVDLTNIYPTLAELCNIETPSVDGLSVVPLLNNKNAEFPPALMTYMKGNHAIRTDRWRYIQYADGTEELYDHSNDPYEWDNLAEDKNFYHIIKNLKQYIPESNADQVSDLK
jgi:arylsulfatase A-like enzyme